MSPPHDADPTHRPRPRSNTNSFPTLPWRKRPEAPLPTSALSTVSTQQPQTIEFLIASLTPPSVPSLSTARTLAQALATTTIPLSQSNCAALNVVLSTLCTKEAPPALRAAGFDILATYLENPSTPPRTTSDRFTLWSLFALPENTPWVSDLWASRFRAAVALTRNGTEIVGIEVPLLQVIKTCIEGAFAGLLARDNISAADRAERERSMETVSAFLTATMSKSENIARLDEKDVSGVLQFMGGLVERSLLLPSDVFGPPLTQETQSPTRLTHRRHHSSTSLPMAASASGSHGHLRRPVDVVVSIYLDHLTAQVPHLSPIHLNIMLPTLFRTLAYYASSLPRLALTHAHEFETSSPLETRIVDTLDPLLNGAYASTCFVILKRHLLPQKDQDLRVSVQTSTGASRALRVYVRRTLFSRLARAYIGRTSADNYTPSGAPGGMDLENSLMERAWAKDEVTRGDLGKVGRIFRRAAEAWVALSPEDYQGGDIGEREEVLMEIAGVLKDVFQEYDARQETDEDVDDDEGNVIGEILSTLVKFITPLKNSDGSPYIVPLSRPGDAPTPFLRTLAFLLNRDHVTTPINPPLTTIYLSISEHLTDTDTADIISALFTRKDLTPASMDWLELWSAIFSKPELTSVERPLARTAVLESLQAVFAYVRDVPTHRHSLVDVLLESCQRRNLEEGGRDGYEVVWHILADEMVLRMTEVQEHEAGEGEANAVDVFVNAVLELLSTTAAEGEDEEQVLPPTITQHSHAPTPSSPPASSPTFSRHDSGFSAPLREKESTMPSVISLLSSLASGGTSSRVPATPVPPPDDTSSVNVVLSSPDPVIMPAAMGAVVALIHIFSQLAFTPYALSELSREVVVRIFRILIDFLSTAKSARVRVAVLQFFFRLRVDRDHRFYSVYKRYDRLGHIATLAGTVGRVDSNHVPGGPDTPGHTDETMDAPEGAKAKPRASERDGRRTSRGREVTRPSRSASSRSRSRAAHMMSPTNATPSPFPESKSRKSIWQVPELLPFNIPETDTPSDGITSYDPDGPTKGVVLPVSMLLSAFVDILQNEKDWEILSYVLCHLPTLLSNKHLFCGPNSKAVVARLLSVLCTGLSQGELGASIAYWPPGLRARDAHGLAYHTLSVLISYRSSYEASMQHVLVEVLMRGLSSGQQSTIKTCLQALSIAAFELPHSMKRFLPQILTKLSQIMTNATIAVHIIDFLAIVGSQPSLYANFIETDFKMVFGVALQYLLLHNRPDASEASPVLSKHVRLMSYYIVYVWFLAVKLADRPRHVKYITRQLLLANEGREEVDESTEVCFDWLARYTYASADPRPAHSMLSEILMKPAVKTPASDVVAEKSWMIGNALITIKALVKVGWMEVVARRPSGKTQFLARVENVPIVGPGEVDPDTAYLPAILAMDRQVDPEEDELYQDVMKTLFPGASELAADEEQPPRPDPITGYVWQGTAPSQRRKDVAIDPGFFALQLSPYPEGSTVRRGSKILDTSNLASFCRILDKMPVIDTHKVGIMYVAPGQTHERDILGNVHGSPAYTRFLEGLGRLINLRGQVDVYAGGLDPDHDGEYAYAWWDDIGQILYHTATLMPNHAHDTQFVFKKRHIGNDYVRIVWNDSGIPYQFDTLSTAFQFVNIVIEAHSLGAIAAFSNNLHENEYFRVMVQTAPGMKDFEPVGDFKLISAENLPLLVRQLSLLADWYASVYQYTEQSPTDEMQTNWRARLQEIKRFKKRNMAPVTSDPAEGVEGILAQESTRDFTNLF
ncbi:hypothetical protein OF83DRAFT_1169744 [Amylostereum chailletii]|nr:hypothetical protein OF83DRAFT_1169744 [Amylostereum chailletii]